MTYPTMGDDALLAIKNSFSSLPLNFELADFFSPFRLLHHFQQTKDASFLL